MPRTKIEVRVTKEEKAIIKAYAETMGCSISELVRRTLLNKKTLYPILIDTKILDKTYYELRKQGGNLNQMMRAINTIGIKKHKPYEIHQVLKETRAAIKKVDSLVDDIRNGTLNL